MKTLPIKLSPSTDNVVIADAGPSSPTKVRTLVLVASQPTVVRFKDTGLAPIPSKVPEMKVKMQLGIATVTQRDIDMQLAEETAVAKHPGHQARDLSGDITLQPGVPFVLGGTSEQEGWFGAILGDLVITASAAGVEGWVGFTQ